MSKTSKQLLLLHDISIFSIDIRMRYSSTYTLNSLKYYTTEDDEIGFYETNRPQ